MGFCEVAVIGTKGVTSRGLFWPGRYLLCSQGYLLPVLCGTTGAIEPFLQLVVGLWS